MQSEIQKLLSSYPIIVSRKVNWGDMDAAQHVNNTVYARWGEVGRVAYFDLFTQTYPTHTQENKGPILANVDCTYIYPITYPDEVYIGTKTIEIMEDRYMLETLIVSSAHKRVAAVVKGTIVYYDYQALKKIRLPIDMEDRIRKFEARIH